MATENLEMRSNCYWPRREDFKEGKEQRWEEVKE